VTNGDAVIDKIVEGSRLAIIPLQRTVRSINEGIL
jgi:hypothetical protein